MLQRLVALMSHLNSFELMPIILWISLYWKLVILVEIVEAQRFLKLFITVILSIINDDQSGYLKGRYIGQNIRILEDIYFFKQNNKLAGILLSIVFENAFDSLNWNVLLKTLEYVNFGMTFIEFIKTMYNDIQSTILNNGTTCTYFKLQRGVR